MYCPSAVRWSVRGHLAPLLSERSVRGHLAPLLSERSVRVSHKQLVLFNLPSSALVLGVAGKANASDLECMCVCLSVCLFVCLSVCLC